MHTGAISRKLVIKTIKTVHFQSIKNVKLRKFRIECCVFTKKMLVSRQCWNSTEKGFERKTCKLTVCDRYSFYHAMSHFFDVLLLFQLQGFIYRSGIGLVSDFFWILAKFLPRCATRFSNEGKTLSDRKYIFLNPDKELKILI